MFVFDRVMTDFVECQKSVSKWTKYEKQKRISELKVTNCLAVLPPRTLVCFYLSLSLSATSCLSSGLPRPSSSSDTPLSLWVCLSYVFDSLLSLFPELRQLPTPKNTPTSTGSLSHLPSSHCHKTLADLARRHIPARLPPISPKSPLFPPPLGVSSLSKDLNPPSCHLCCLDLKHKHVPLFWLIKGRKQGDGGGLI